MKVNFGISIEGKSTDASGDDPPEIKRAKKYLSELKKFKVDNNCQKFAAALELKYRGTDKQVTPTLSPFARVFDVPKGSKSPHAMWHLFKTIDPITFTGKDILGKVTEQMLKWGEGSRAIISARWESGSGHVFNLIVIDKTVYLMDGTANRFKKASESDYLKNKAVSVTLVRSDKGTVDKELVEATFEECKDRFHLDFEKGGTIRSPAAHSILGFLRLIAHKEGETFVVNHYTEKTGEYRKIGKVRTLDKDRTYTDGEFKLVAWNYEWV